MRGFKLRRGDKLALALLLAGALAGWLAASSGESGGYTVKTEREASMEALAQAGSGASTQPPDIGPLDLNGATAEELMLLPGIGEVLAARIVAYREEHGSFSDTEEIMEVHGIGETLYAGIEAYIIVS